MKKKLKKMSKDRLVHKKELTFYQQKEILQEMFGFTVVGASEGDIDVYHVIYDENGDDFYGSDENCKYDLSTIAGIIRYAECRGELTGYLKCQNDLRNMLGIGLK